MEYVGLGYVKVNKYLHILDVLVKECDGEYKVIVPVLPVNNISLRDIPYIDILGNFTRIQEDQKGIRPIKLNSDGREYIAVDVQGVGEDVAYRVHEYEARGREYIVRVELKENVMSVNRDHSTPEVFYNEYGEMELVEAFKENIKKEVKIFGVTKIDTWEKDIGVYEELKDSISRGTIINEFIKEAGDSEIALSILQQSKNL